MIDLNDFLMVIKSGVVSTDQIMVIRKNGEIVDYVLPQEQISESEVTEVMNVKDIVFEIFNLY